MITIQVSQCYGDSEHEMIDIIDFQERSSNYDEIK